MSGGDAALVARHHAPLTAYVRSLVRSPPLAADIVQETWVRAIPTLRAGTVENARAYLYRIARNLVTDAAREQRKWTPYVIYGELAPIVADDAPSAERETLARDRLTHVLRLVEELPPRCREVFALRKLDGLGQEQIATQLSITRGMVEKHLRHALIVLATQMGEIDDAE